MTFDFTQILILLLLALLFGKDTILGPILKRFGFITNDNGHQPHTDAPELPDVLSAVQPLRGDSLVRFIIDAAKS